jgi:SAM-dependent methyltransferase
MNIPEGVATIANYEQLLDSAEFKKLKAYSNEFLLKHKTELEPYGSDWVRDPLHQWSRQWEYPFVADQVEQTASVAAGSPVKMLDAGSGVSFFPYFLVERHQGLELTCCDTDQSLPEVYQRLNEQRSQNVSFTVQDIRHTSFEADTFDIVSCISVLEHTEEYPRIIEEFARILKPGGVLVLTFDISLDGCSDIPLAEAKQLMAKLRERFAIEHQEDLEDELANRRIVTTRYAQVIDPAWLPWRHPLLSSILAAARKRKLPSAMVKQLTFACYACHKRP